MSAANNNANPNSADTGRAWFCPACGCADLEVSTLAGGGAKCNICSWKGEIEDLPTFIFQHDMGSQEEVYRHFFLDVRKILGQSFATQIGHLLVKWGFLDSPNAQNHAQVVRMLSRYVGSITKAAVVAVIEERRAMEKEKFREQPS